MRCPPADVGFDDLVNAIDTQWNLRVKDLTFVPIGSGAQHWVAVAEDDERWFVTCDDLDDKPWLGADRESVFANLRAAYGAAHHLRKNAGLRFVAGPVPTGAGDLAVRLDSRHALAVTAFLDGTVGCWGDPLDPGDRLEVLGLLAALHGARLEVPVPDRRSTPVGGRPQLEAALGDLDRPWGGGPFAEPLRAALGGETSLISGWLGEVDGLAGQLALSPARVVLTHGEPHPGNLLRSAGHLFLLDWDTVAVDRAERDLWMLDDGTGAVPAAYEELTGRSVDPAALSLYQRAWTLSDLASFVTQLRGPHPDDEDSAAAWSSVLSILGSAEPRPFG